MQTSAVRTLYPVKCLIRREIRPAPNSIVVLTHASTLPPAAGSATSAAVGVASAARGGEPERVGGATRRGAREESLLHAVATSRAAPVRTSLAGCRILEVTTGGRCGLRIPCVRDPRKGELMYSCIVLYTSLLPYICLPIADVLFGGQNCITPCQLIISKVLNRGCIPVDRQSDPRVVDLLEGCRAVKCKPDREIHIHQFGSVERGFEAGKGQICVPVQCADPDE